MYTPPRKKTNMTMEKPTMNEDVQMYFPLKTFKNGVNFLAHHLRKSSNQLPMEAEDAEGFPTRSSGEGPNSLVEGVRLMAFP